MLVQKTNSNIVSFSGLKINSKVSEPVKQAIRNSRVFSQVAEDYDLRILPLLRQSQGQDRFVCQIAPLKQSFWDFFKIQPKVVIQVGTDEHSAISEIERIDKKPELFFRELTNKIRQTKETGKLLKKIKYFNQDVSFLEKMDTFREK